MKRFLTFLSIISLLVSSSVYASQSENILQTENEEVMVQVTGRSKAELDAYFKYGGKEDDNTTYVYSNYIPTFLIENGYKEYERDGSGISEDSSYFFALFSEKEGYNRELVQNEDFTLYAYTRDTWYDFGSYPIDGTEWTTLPSIGSGHISTGYDLSIYEPDNIPKKLYTTGNPLTADFSDQLKNITMTITKTGADHDHYATITQDGDNWGNATFTVSADVTEKADGSYTADLICKSTGDYYKYHVWGETRDITSFTIKENVPIVIQHPADGVELSRSSLSLDEGETATLTATVSPDNADDPSVSWKSDNESVATVDNGVVTAVSEGETDITVTTNDGGFTDTCHVTVKKVSVPVTSVTLNKESLELEEGDSYTLTATVLPDNADDPSVSWESGDDSVAKVDNGKITAIKAGTTVITATAGGKSAECAVTVREKSTPETPDEKPEDTVKTVSVNIGDYTVEYPEDCSFYKDKKATFNGSVRLYLTADGSDVGYGSIKIARATKTGGTYFKIKKPNVSDKAQAKIIKKAKFSVTIKPYSVSSNDSVSVTPDSKGGVRKVTINGIKLKKKEFSGTPDNLTFTGRFTGSWKPNN